MIFNITGTGGTTALNFKIIGNPQPTSPNENTIWIDTDDEIVNWFFSATEPENPVSGMVWIHTGASSLVMFNALKKNGIYIYPLAAKQYTGAEWLGKTAKIYQSGHWKIFENALNLDSENWKVMPNAAYGHTFTTENGILTFAASQGHVNQWQSAGRYYQEKLDLTPYSTMTVDLIFTHSGGGNIKFGLTQDLNVSDLGSAPAVVARDTSFTGQLQLDISALTGEYYAAMNLYVGGDTSMSAIIHSIKFE